MRSRVSQNRSFPIRLGCLAVATVAIALSGGDVFAALGSSFMNIPGVTGSWQGESYKSWVRVTARYWIDAPVRYTTTLGIGNPLVSGPPAPVPGKSNKLAIALDKHNPDLPALMALCANKTTVPEVSFAEPASKEISTFPAFWEYKLKGVQFGSCDVVPNAPEQALVATFQDIEWLNYSSKGPYIVPVISTAADIPNLQPLPASPKTKTFLVTWFGWATLGDDSTCPAFTETPPEEEFFRLLPKDKAAEIKSKRGEKPISFGGPDRDGPYFMDQRGPNMLNACAMPGIVRDPGHVEPKTTVALGVNLDGNDGTGEAAAGTCKHENFVSPDGKLKGVDNQMYRVFGCVPGYRGKKGYMNQTHNARRADGNVVTLIQISGIDDPKNDDHVEIGIFYGLDKPMRSTSGAFIPNYSFRLTDDPNYARFNQRWAARIVDGYIVTSPIKTWHFNNGQGGNISLADAQFRLEITPDGNLKGVVGGYIDWHGITASSSYNEKLFTLSCPGMYQSFKRNADGMRDPVTGECNGVSMAYELDAVPAFITPMAPKQTKVSSAGQIAEKRP
jgi:hypothetical protein